MTKLSLLILTVIFTSSCTTMQLGSGPLYSITYENAGENDVYNFLVEYGEIKLPSPRGDDQFRRGASGHFAARMRVPQNAIVHWHDTNGQAHEQTFQISKYVSARQTSARGAVIIFSIHDTYANAFYSWQTGAVDSRGFEEYARREIP